MVNLAEIVKSWENATFPTEELKKRATERAAICAGCEMVRKVAIPGLSFAYCGVCNCPISKKTYSPKKSCPLNKWTV
jgi:hypothetical protein